MSKFKGKTEGIDPEGAIVRLGERDSSGHIVGYIDEGGHPWESILERDAAVCYGRYDEAFMDWRRGLKRFRPSVWQYAIKNAQCRKPSHLRKVVAEMKDSVRFWHRIRKQAGSL